MRALSFVKNLIDNFRSLPLVIQLSLIVIVSAVAFTLIAIIVMLYYRYQRYRREKRLAKLIPVIDDLIFAYISFDSSDAQAARFSSKEEIVNRLRRLIRGRRQLAVNRLTEYKKDLRGNMSQELNQLFLELHLDRFCLRKFRSLRRFKKVQGLTEFAAMGIPVADAYILPLPHHRSREVRIMARHAYIKLSKNDPFKFFDVSTDRLLVWDQIELFRIITTNENITIPNFGSWLTYSNNPSIIHFCLRLVVHYNQTEAIPAVVRLLDTRDHELRAAAINCLGKIKAESTEDKLVSIYNDQPPRVQAEILKALGRIQSGRYIDFLTNEFLYASDFRLRKNAAKSLVNNSRMEPGLIEQLMATTTPENQLILKHCMDPLIKYV